MRPCSAGSGPAHSLSLYRLNYLLFLGLFNDTASSSDYIASIARWQEAVVVSARPYYFGKDLNPRPPEYQSRVLPGWPRHLVPQLSQTWSQLFFKLCQIQTREKLLIRRQLKQRYTSGAKACSHSALLDSLSWRHYWRSRFTNYVSDSNLGRRIGYLRRFSWFMHLSLYTQMVSPRSKIGTAVCHIASITIQHPSNTHPIIR
jgi:hypothetical protein